MCFFSQVFYFLLIFTFLFFGCSFHFFLNLCICLSILKHNLCAVRMLTHFCKCLIHRASMKWIKRVMWLCVRLVPFLIPLYSFFIFFILLHNTCGFDFDLSILFLCLLHQPRKCFSDWFSIFHHYHHQQQLNTSSSFYTDRSIKTACYRPRTTKQKNRNCKLEIS